MAFEDLFVALRDDQLGKLRREESFQPPDAPEFLDLFCDPRLEPAVQFHDLIGALAQFTQQSRILHRDHCLRVASWNVCCASADCNAASATTTPAFADAEIAGSDTGEGGGRLCFLDSREALCYERPARRSAMALALDRLAVALSTSALVF